MTRKTKRDLEKDVEDLADDTPTDDEPQTKAEAGITADFIRGANEEPQELPEGWTWEEHEDVTNTGAGVNVAVREDDQDEGDDPDGPDDTSSNMVEENGAKFVAFTENTEEDAGGSGGLLSWGRS